MGHSKVETTKNIYGHLFAWDRFAVRDAMNQAVSRLYAYGLPGDDASAIGAAPPLALETLGLAARPSEGRTFRELSGPGRT